MSKTITIIAIVLLVAMFMATAFISYNSGKRSVKIPVPVYNHTYTTVPVLTKIIRENLPARIDTVWADSTKYEIATYREVIDTNRVIADISVRYDEKLNMFSMLHNITTTIDSIYIEKTIDKYIEKRYPLISPCFGLGVSFSDGDILSSSIDAGAMILGKYQITGFIDTEKHYGARLGVVW